ncbi:hypothetical protein L7F22_021168 [Adiantum nelumboides]|nr:hypothetical protein [Adiantum nelumboides]
MRAIRDTHGVLHTDLDQVLEISSAFYEDLFTVDPVIVEILDAREHIWSFTHSRVTKDMCYHLMAPFTVEELHDAVHSLTPSSCSGDDGLTRGRRGTKHYRMEYIPGFLTFLQDEAVFPKLKQKAYLSAAVNNVSTPWGIELKKNEAEKELHRPYVMPGPILEELDNMSGETQNKAESTGTGDFFRELDSTLSPVNLSFERAGASLQSDELVFLTSLKNDFQQWQQSFQPYATHCNLDIKKTARSLLLVAGAPPLVLAHAFSCSAVGGGGARPGAAAERTASETPRQILRGTVCNRDGRCHIDFARHIIVRPCPVSLCLLSRRSMAPRWGSRIPDSILQDMELRTALSQIWVGDISNT